MRGSEALSIKITRMSLGDRFSQFGITVTATRQNPAGRQDCVVFGRKARWGVGELVGQSMQFSRRALGRSSN